MRIDGESRDEIPLLARRRVGDLDFHAARMEMIRVAAYYHSHRPAQVKRSLLRSRT